MTRDQWTKLFQLNDRLTNAYALVVSDIQHMEKISGLNANEAMDALEHFAAAMTKMTDVLNERLKEDQEAHRRELEVEDVIREVNQKARNKNEKPRKNHSEPS